MKIRYLGPPKRSALPHKPQHPALTRRNDALRFTMRTESRSQLSRLGLSEGFWSPGKKTAPATKSVSSVTTAREMRISQSADPVRSLGFQHLTSIDVTTAPGLSDADSWS
jgi:hypothetical protein